MLPTLLIATCLAAADAKDAADVIYLNGKVLTLDARGRVAEAVAVKGDKIVAVGNAAEVRKRAGPQTKERDLGGRVLLPGFYAAHDHFLTVGNAALYKVNLNSPPLGPIKDMADLIAALQAKAKQTPRGEWVVGRGYDDTLLKERRHPTRRDLDQVSTEHPVWVTHISGHLGAANGLALQRAKVTKDSKAPLGAVIRKDPQTGEPDGVFEECGYLVTRFIPGPSDVQAMRAIEWAAQEYARQGVTTTVIAGGGKASAARLKQGLTQGLLPLRVLTMTGPGEAEAAREVLAGVDNSRLRAGAVKLFQDGSIQGYTGYLSKPYHQPPADKPSYRGFPARGREALTERVKQLHRAGYQLAIHGNGDAAIDDILHAFAEAQKDTLRPDARHRIEHCQTAREDQLDAMRRLGITPSFFVGHVYYWGDRHRDLFLGPERAARISPLESARKRGIRFTLHDDTPVTPVNPLHSVWVAVNRLTRNDQLLGREQRITAEQALRSVTTDAAWQNFEEDRKGSIEVGKLADFVILDEDPLAVEPTRIRDLKVQETIVGGRKVFRRP